MDYLHAHGFRVLPLADVITVHAPAEEQAERAVVITFDDGHASNYTHALPLLRSRGFTATFFVTVGSIGQEGYVNWGQLREMEAAGMTIASHTLTHPILTELTDKQVMFEMQQSKKLLEDGLGISVTLFSNPHIFTNRNIQRLAFESGYQAICISRAGYYIRGSGQKIIDRINIRADYSRRDFQRLARCGAVILLIIKMQRMLAGFIRAAIGIRRYETLKQTILRTK
jgi:peptidoglycan/xylan/chitin deacetylase (PgdA/CDA1 family)